MNTTKGVKKMFYYSTKSQDRIAHYAGCRFISAIKPENLGSFSSIKKVRKNKYSICSCCSPLIKLLRKEKKEIQNYPFKNGLSYELVDDEMHIHSYFGEWRVILNTAGKNLQLHHKNKFFRKKKTAIPGFHRQKYCVNSIVKTFDYITDHDRFCIHNTDYYKPKFTSRKTNRKKEKKEKLKDKKRKIRNVLDLIENLASKEKVSVKTKLYN